MFQYLAQCLPKLYVDPDCQEFLRKGHYLDETREDTLYNKDVEKRKEVLAVFNK